jgi:hypothetical protein
MIIGNNDDVVGESMDLAEDDDGFESCPEDSDNE